MKKLYSLLFVLGLVSMTFQTKADPLSIILRVTDATAVAAEVSYAAYPLQNGDNVLNIGPYDQVKIIAVGDNFLKSVTNLNAEPGSWGSKIDVYNMNNATFYPSEENNGNVYEIVTESSTALRTGSQKINVDNASKVSVVRSGTNSKVDLVDGENTISFIPEVESSLQISSSSGANMPLYSLTIGDSVVEARGNVYYINIPCETINVTANFPDKDCAVTISLNEGSENFITSVTDIEDKELVATDGKYIVKSGTEIFLNGKTNDYRVDKYSVNGQETSFYSPQRVVVIDDTKIEINAHKYLTFNVTVDIDDAENVTVFRGTSWAKDTCKVVTGVNTVTLNENNTMLSFLPNDGCLIDEVTVNGSPISLGYSGEYQVYGAENDVIAVKSHRIVRDQKAVAYFAFDPASLEYWNFSRKGSYSKIPIVEGYNTIEFYDGDNPFSFFAYGVENLQVYVNGEKAEDNYGSYSLTLANGTVVKFFSGEPAFYKVSFQIEGDATKLNVVYDMIATLDNFELPVTVTQGTPFAIKAATGEEMEVTVNDLPVEAVDGVFNFVPEGDTNVFVKLGTTGVEGVAVEAAKAADVYNLQGIRVKSGASAEAVKNLPAGIYIIGGKKIMVK